jgi:hypothetical protein
MKNLLQDLKSFTGGDGYYRHALFRKFVYTEGVQYLAENAGAYWLLDFIFAKQSAAIAAQEFQVWTIKLLPAGGASITVGDGNGNRVARFQIPYTDFPLDGFSLWLIGGTLLLPSEY